MNLQELIKRNALFCISHSGGKDSQAMYNYLLERIPHKQIAVIHAHLGEMEWEGVIDHINATISHPLNIAHPVWADGTEKTLLGMVAHRFKTKPEVPSWPSTSNRQCTSDLKRGPIHKEIRRLANERNSYVVVNCTGMRWEESTARSKLKEWDELPMLTTQNRTAYEWRPIIDWTTEKVFGYIEEVGQKPFWAYQKNTRLSCVFCIMGSQNDLSHGAEQRPELYQKYIDMEQHTGYTMFHKRSLADVIASNDPEFEQKKRAQMCGV